VKPREAFTRYTTVPPGLEHLVSIDPQVVGGEPCFTSDRVPLETVVDNLAGGCSIQQIFRSYRALELKHVQAVLHWEANLARRDVRREARAL
jgi:uncharacterized protein (DUF433 family)